MGRRTFEPALGAPHWPWPDLHVFVLTSSPLPEGAPDGVTTAATPEALLEKMRASDLDGDVHLVGGQRTVDAFRALDVIDCLGLVVLPLVLGQGIPLSMPTSRGGRLHLESTRAFPDGVVENLYTPQR
jgi:dihydrofolate reductase